VSASTSTSLSDASIAAAAAAAADEKAEQAKVRNGVTSLCGKTKSPGLSRPHNSAKSSRFPQKALVCATILFLSYFPHPPRRTHTPHPRTHRTYL
jgi:hypothetical protein